MTIALKLVMPFIDTAVKGVLSANLVLSSQHSGHTNAAHNESLAQCTRTDLVHHELRFSSETSRVTRNQFYVVKNQNTVALLDQKPFYTLAHWTDLYLYLKPWKTKMYGGRRDR